MTTDRNFAIADELASLADELGSSSAAVALAWIIGRPGTSFAILGPRRLDQLTDNLDGIYLELPAEVRHHLHDISTPSNAAVNGVPIAELG